MNLALRKIAMLEQSMNEKEEEARIAGYSTCPIDKELKEKITKLMDRVRLI